MAPVPIEDVVKETFPDIVGNAMVVGDKRKHLAVILTLKTILDANNQPTDVLHKDVQAFLRERGSQATTAPEVIEEDNQDFKKEIMDRIKIANTKAISNAQKIHKFMIAPKEFSQAGGELTPTMKLKRHFVLELYEKEIQEMYEHETQSSMW